MAAFAQLAVVGRGNNTCVYVIAIFMILLFVYLFLFDVKIKGD